MEPDFIQSSVLAVLQGVTEFLPISSSAHLILPSELLGWPDQGLAFDVIVHLGSLLAVLVYFRRDLQRLTWSWIQSLAYWRNTLAARDKEWKQDAVIAWSLLIATIPAGIVGLLWVDVVTEYARDSAVIAVTSIMFGLLLLLADRSGSRQYSLTALGWRSALIIGFAQALALIPGTSRSGITMSAALLLGFDRQAATRFSFLLAIPIIAASSLLEIAVLFNSGISVAVWLQLAGAMLISAGVAFLCIHYFLQFITKIGFLPFVLYRLVLGVLLLGISGIL